MSPGPRRGVLHTDEHAASIARQFQVRIICLVRQRGYHGTGPAHPHEARVGVFAIRLIHQRPGLRHAESRAGGALFHAFGKQHRFTCRLQLPVIEPLSVERTAPGVDQRAVGQQGLADVRPRDDQSTVGGIERRQVGAGLRLRPSGLQILMQEMAAVWQKRHEAQRSAIDHPWRERRQWSTRRRGPRQHGFAIHRLGQDHVVLAPGEPRPGIGKHDGCAAIDRYFLRAVAEAAE